MVSKRNWSPLMVPMVSEWLEDRRDRGFRFVLPACKASSVAVSVALRRCDVRWELSGRRKAALCMRASRSHESALIGSNELTQDMGVHQALDVDGVVADAGHAEYLVPGAHLLREEPLLVADLEVGLGGARAALDLDEHLLAAVRADGEVVGQAALVVLVVPKQPQAVAGQLRLQHLLEQLVHELLAQVANGAVAQGVGVGAAGFERAQLLFHLGWVREPFGLDELEHGDAGDDLLQIVVEDQHASQRPRDVLVAHGLSIKQVYF
ncbi:uncharacterized protein BcabD6B2_17750 [Babesia caballi]|uniref:Uncharacterized protein n=1 Tax=Babesia caballi TaxID=5871 RepID=A0AAV4LS05_BABCB|nr:hypothetical protein, conserved [Babesia caballi]